MRVADYLTKRLLDEGVISDDEREIIWYGLENLGNALSGFILVLIVGGCFGDLYAGFILWILLYPLRKHAGGYHANKKSECFLTSTILLITTFGCLYVWNWSYILYVIIVASFGSFIFLMAPVDNQNKKLDKTERRVYRKRTRYILILEIFLFVLALLLDWRKTVSVIAIVFVITGTSLAIGLIEVLQVVVTDESS